MKNFLLLCLIFSLIISFCGCGISFDTLKNSDKTTANDMVDDDNFVQSEKEQIDMTMGQRNALRKAKSYLNMMAFSREGLIEQLEFEGFSNEDSIFGADNCGADWNEQAAKKAKSYLDMMAFSRDGLIEQLEFEGFTYEQAVYGVTANGY